MQNIFEVAHTLVNHVRVNFPEDIALIAYYGSYAQGTAAKRSDLDFFFIPATSDGYRASLQFVLEDISFDFWPISWERAERMASFEEPQTTIIANCEILYVRSEEDRARFLKLRETTLQMSRQRLKLAEKAEAGLREVYVHLYKMSRIEAAGDLSVFRTEAYNILTKLFQSLALLNGTYFTKGWGKNKDQIMQLPLKPAELEERLHKIMISRITNEIRELCEKLTQDTLDIVLELKEAYAEASYPDRMHGFYEEIKGILDKVRTACENENYESAFFGALAAQDEIARALFYAEKGFSVNLGLEGQALYNRLGFPDLIPLLDPLDFTTLLESVERLDTLLQNHLKERGVLIHRFEGITSLVQFLETRYMGF